MLSGNDEWPFVHWPFVRLAFCPGASSGGSIYAPLVGLLLHAAADTRGTAL